MQRDIGNNVEKLKNHVNYWRIKKKPRAKHGYKSEDEIIERWTENYENHCKRVQKWEKNW